MSSDDAVLKGYEHLGLSEGEVIRAFWRIGLKYPSEFGAAGATNVSESPAARATQIKVVK